MISYAQNAEDVLLNRAFTRQSSGFYVDIGAGHPWVDSVTCHFYLHGWRGLNVEPRPRIASMLQKWRPLDLLAHCCISDRDGEIEFFEVQAPCVSTGDGGGLSTLDRDLANRYSEKGYEVTCHRTRQTTLASLLTKYEVTNIDFLKVDVEGHESQVIAGGDWNRWRPRVVVVEAITPVEHVDSSGCWKQQLLNCGYLDAAFDGINRYFVPIEDQKLAECLSAPVSILDGFVTWQSHLHRQFLRRKVGRRWRKAVATDRNVPSGLQPGHSITSFFRRLVQRS